MLDQVIVAAEGILAPILFAIFARISFRHVVRLGGDMTLKGIHPSEPGTVAAGTAIWLMVFLFTVFSKLSVVVTLHETDNADKFIGCRFVYMGWKQAV